ncbi:MAG: CDP-glycerol glycerophosphotransferase family protein, partial [Eubacterium sp.]|nr:CDP-glycerol glycerophosphotransferase family protein [Eubacterium sp.]
ELTHKYGGNWRVIVRLHPNIKNLQNRLFYTDRIINGSNYEETDELIIASSWVITDYSGCMFEALEARKKVMLYAVDVEKYMMEDRGAYWDIYNLPFPLAKSNEELRMCIRNFDEITYNERCEKLRKKIGYFNTADSSKKVVDEIIKRVWGDEYK